MISLVSGAEPYFEEDFSSGTQNPNLKSYSPAFEVKNGSLHRTNPSENFDRQYLKTVLSDYLQRDFVFELTFTTNIDIILLYWRFLGDAPPLAPFSRCGIDRTEDNLAPCDFSNCPAD
ncbi:MAG: hypothetical protein HY717_00470 [Planctomycetes bacterium]|nr:hypothetical protein [Planctomycetota bacterium]